MKHTLRIVTAFLVCMSFAAFAEVEGTATWNAGHTQLIRFRLPTQSPGRRLLKAAAPDANPTDEILAKWGVADRAGELKERSRETDMLGRTHTRYRQIYKSTDVDVAKYRQPYEDKETEEEVPGKYDIILDLPKDDEGKVAPSGFYRLDW